MNTLTEIIRNLVILAFLSLVLELVLPRGNMAKYVRLVMGLLVILVVIQPLLTLSGGDWSELAESVFHQQAEDNTEAIVSDGNNMADQWSETALAEYEATVADQVEAMALTVDGVEAAMAEAVIQDDNLSSVAVVLTLTGDLNVEDEEQVRDIRQQTEKIVGDFFDLSSSQIEVSIARLAD